MTNDPKRDQDTVKMGSIINLQAIWSIDYDHNYSLLMNRIK